MFKDKRIYFHPARFSKTRLNLFETQVIKNDGSVVKTTDLATHVIVDETCDKSSLPTSLWTKEPYVLGSMWLSQCIKKKSTVDLHQYIIDKPCQKRLAHSPEPICRPKTTEVLQRNTFSEAKDVKKFACSQPSAVVRDESSCNSVILSQLQKLADTYRVRGDQWRTHGYEKAISAIRRYGKEITTFEEVVALEGVGAKMATKVMEIIATGSLRKVSELCETEQSKVISIFNNIWGAGPAAANAWYLKGHRTLNDLTENENLTKQQVIGIKYYNEFLERIPKNEVEEIGQKVDLAAKAVDSSLATMLCGSYRRGKLTCGDIDVVVIRPDRLVAKDVLTSILAKLKESGWRLTVEKAYGEGVHRVCPFRATSGGRVDQIIRQRVQLEMFLGLGAERAGSNRYGFVTDDLVSLEKSGNQRKYLGVCKLPGNNNLHRRLDIFVVPQSESACAIMHYTGSALFNRSIRLLAAKKNMHLSEHSLAAGVMRQGTEIQNQGLVLKTPTEESIFEHLGLEYRPPEERDH